MDARRLTLLLLATLALPGCDKLKELTGGETLTPQQMDAEAVGYACRVSQKAPEACMKENDTQSPTFVLSGWRKADADIKGGTIDPNMSNIPLVASAVLAASAPEEASGNSDEKSADAKSEKSGEKNAKSDEKSDKHEKADKSEKSDKSGKSDKSEKIGKPERSGGSDSSGKSGSNKNDHSNDSKGKSSDKSS